MTANLLLQTNFSWHTDPFIITDKATEPLNDSRRKYDVHLVCDGLRRLQVAFQLVRSTHQLRHVLKVKLQDENTFSVNLLIITIKPLNSLLKSFSTSQIRFVVVQICSVKSLTNMHSRFNERLRTFVTIIKRID